MLIKMNKYCNKWIVHCLFMLVNTLRCHLLTLVIVKCIFVYPFVFWKVYIFFYYVDTIFFLSTFIVLIDVKT